MRTITRLAITTAAVLSSAAPALAQAGQDSQTTKPTAVAMSLAKDSTVKATADSGNAKAEPAPLPPAQVMNPAAASRAATLPKITIQHIRALDQRGINVFESPKWDNVEYNGFALAWGAAFTSQFQGLDHSNTATPNVVAGVNQNQLMRTGHGFNNETANLYLNAQLAPGIRVALTSYLSARHHQETWVKDGYLLVDESPIKWQPLVDLMQIVTVKAGHFEIN